MQIYTTKDLASKYHVTEKTIINYLNQICNNLGLNINDFTRINNKKVQEYVLTEEQELLFGALIKHIDLDPYVTKRRSYGNSTEAEIKTHRDNLLKEIDSFTNVSLKDLVKETDEYRFASEFKDIHDQFDEIRDSILFCLEQFPIATRLEIEKQILSTTKNLASNLLKKFTEQLEQEAITELEIIDEEGIIELPSDEEVASKVTELLNKRITEKKPDIQFNYGGLNLVERAISRTIKEVTSKDK